MTAPASLRDMERVLCMLCKTSFPGSEVDSHDASTEHVRRRNSWLIDRAVLKVTNWACPGPVGRMRGNALLDSVTETRHAQA